MKYVSFLHVQNVIPYVQMFYIITITLTSNERRCVSNQWQLECLFQQIVEARNKGSWKIRITGRLWGVSTSVRLIPLI